MQKFGAFMLLMAVCFVMSMPVMGVSPTMNDVGNKEFHLWFDVGINVAPSGELNADSTILINGVPTPFTRFESENLRALGIENNNTAFGSITVMRYDDASVESPLFDQYLTDECIKDMDAAPGTYRNQDYHGKKITVATTNSLPYVTSENKIIFDERKFSQGRIRFGNFVVVLTMDQEHFNQTLDSLTFKDLRK